VTHRLLLTTILLVAVNLLPLAGVLFFNWSVYEILLLFWAENLVIGLYAIARLVTLYRRNGDGRTLLLIPFFCVHFGLFTLVHGIFVMAIFRPEDHVSGQAGMSLWIPFLALLISHGASYVMNFLGNREYNRMEGGDVMFAPYRRVIILHLTIIFGGALVMWLGEPVFALTLLVVLKIVIDIVTHHKEHMDKKEAEARRQANPEGREDAHIFRRWD
jgi:hypothetical protein